MKVKYVLMALLCLTVHVPVYAKKGPKHKKSTTNVVLKKQIRNGKNKAFQSEDLLMTKMHVIDGSSPKNPKHKSKKHQNKSTKKNKKKIKKAKFSPRFLAIADDLPNNISQAPLQTFDNNNRIFLQANFEVNGDMDSFSFNIPESGFLRVIGLGNLDTVAELYLTNGSNVLLNSNDDSLQDLFNNGLNFLMENFVVAGKHTVKMGGFDNSVTGNYAVIVEFFPGETSVQSVKDDHPAAFQIPAMSPAVFDFSGGLFETQSLSGILETPSDSDVFKLVLDTRSLVTITSSSNLGIRGALLTDNGFTRFDTRGNFFTDDIDPVNNNLNFRIVEVLDPGTYYIQASPRFDSTNTGAYQINAITQAAPTEDFANDINASMNDQNAQIFDGVTVTNINGAQINYIGDKDVFKINLAEDSILSFVVNSSFSKQLGIFKANGETIEIVGGSIANPDPSFFFDTNINRKVLAGEYYAFMESNLGQTGSYNLSITRTDVPTEADGFPDLLSESLTATFDIEANQTINGSFDFVGDLDIVGLSFTNPGFITLKNTGSLGLRLDLFRNNATGAFDIRFLDPGEMAIIDSSSITPDTYKLLIENSDFPVTTGAYSIETGFVPLSGATALSLGSNVSDALSSPNNLYKLFSIETTENGVIDLIANSNFEQSFELFNSNQNSLFSNFTFPNFFTSAELSTGEAEAGTYYLLVTGDAGAFSLSNTFTSYGLGNFAPRFFDQITNREVNPGDLIDIDFSASDFNGADNIAITGTLLNGDPLPVVINFTDNNDRTANLSWTPTTNDLGTYQIKVEAKDDNQISASQTFQINVVDGNPSNSAPVLSSIGNQTIVADTALSLSLNATDLDSDPLTFDLTLLGSRILPSGLSFTDNGNGSASISWTPTNAQVGTYQFKASVSDGTNTTDETFTVTVTQSQTSGGGSGGGGGSSGGGSGGGGSSGGSGGGGSSGSSGGSPGGSSGSGSSDDGSNTDDGAGSDDGNNNDPGNDDGDSNTENNVFNVAGITPNDADVSPNSAIKVKKRKTKTVVKLKITPATQSSPALSALIDKALENTNGALRLTVSVAEEFKSLTKLVLPKSAKKDQVINIDPNSKKPKKRKAKVGLVIKNKKLLKAFQGQSSVEIPITITELNSNTKFEGKVLLSL